MPSVDARAVDTPTIYAGLIFGWFGHFITESLPNLMAVAEAKKAYPDATILAHAHGGIDPEVWKARYARHLNFFFDQLGLDLDELDFVLEPLQAKRLIVPEAPFTGKFSYSPDAIARIDAKWPATGRNRRLYFSRTRVLKGPRLTNEPEIEAAFAARGFDVVHLQDLGLDDQLALVREAGVIAGPQGSALHWSLYAGGCRKVISLGYGSRLQSGICRARGQDYVELRGRRPRGAASRVREVDPAKIGLLDIP